MSDLKKRLSFVLGNYWGQCQGGAELQAFYIEQEALRMGWTTDCCFLSNSNPIEANYTSTLRPIVQKKIWNKLANIKYPYAIDYFLALKKMKPDIIYQRAAFSVTGVAAYFAIHHKCKFIFHIASDGDIENIRLPWAHPHKIPEIMLMKFGIRKADQIIAQTKFQADQLKKNYNRNAIVIPNGHPIPEDRIKSQDKISVLWIANWKMVKQPEIFIDLVKQLQEMRNVRFIMLGRTDRYDDLVAKARENSVEVMGEVPHDQVNILLSHAHILVNTSQQEGFSNTFIQAWMRGVPVVSLQVDPDDILKNEKIGFCSGSFDQLVTDTRRIIEDKEMRECMGIRARKYAVKNHSLDNIKKITELFSELLDA